jgi:hypothetical protein
MALLMPQNKNHSQSGNVFIIILVAVFLFGALMFTFSRSGSQGGSSISKQEAKIAAQEILNYARLVEGAVDRVRRNGCSENEISFENDTVAGYTNPNAPVDKSCHVFDDNGGKIEYTLPQDAWNTGSEQWQFNSSFQVTGVGKTCSTPNCSDLNLHTNKLKNNICLSINQLLNINTDTIPIDSDYSFSAYIGSFSNPTDISDELNSNILQNQPTGCFFSTADNQNFFYHVLLAR